jgi:hypothetical protein
MWDEKEAEALFSALGDVCTELRALLELDDAPSSCEA